MALIAERGGLRPALTRCSCEGGYFSPRIHHTANPALAAVLGLGIGTQVTSHGPAPAWPTSRVTSLSSLATFNCQPSTFPTLSIESNRSPMTDQPPSDRFKSEMPHIPGVSGPRASPASTPAVKLVIGLLAVLLVVFLGARWALRPKRAVHSALQQPQIEVPSPAPDPSTLLPHATDTEPG